MNNGVVMCYDNDFLKEKVNERILQMSDNDFEADYSMLRDEIASEIMNGRYDD